MSWQFSQFLNGLRAVIDSSDYDSAIDEEKVLFRRVLNVIERLADAENTRAVCYGGVLTYAAGMVCFACSPDWAAIVQEGEPTGGARSVSIDREDVNDLWAMCEPFGSLVDELNSAVSESTLALSSQQSAPDMSMFLSQQALEQWLHDDVALRPLSTTSSQQEVYAACRSVDGEYPETGGVRAGMHYILKSASADNAVRDIDLEFKAGVYPVMTMGVASKLNTDWNDLMNHLEPTESKSTSTESRKS